MSDLRAFSRNFIREFVELYRAHPCLWQTKSKEYLDRNKKNEAYKILMKKLQTVQPDATKNTVINKINTLRGGFRREYKKLQNSQKSGSGADDIYVPSLWYYELLLFVKDQETPRASTSNIQTDEEDDFEEHSQEGVDDIPIESEKQINENSEKIQNETQNYLEPNLHSPTNDSSTIAMSDSTQSSTTLGAPTTRSVLNREKPRKRKTPSQSIDKADRILNAVDARLNNPEDEFTVIGKNIAHKLRRLPRETKIYTEKLINDILFQAELGQISQYTKIISEQTQPIASPQSNWNRSTINNNNYHLHNFDASSSNNLTSTYFAAYNPSHNAGV